MRCGGLAAERHPALIADVGRTPLVEIEHLPGWPRETRLFAKLEARNPGGSIKDRPVARMLLAALSAGRLGGGRRLLDSSSGNAGIAYAMFGASLGIPVSLVVPGNASRERLDRIRSHGAKLVLTDPLEGYDHAIREACRLAREAPDLYYYCDQYSNPENWRAHYETTGAEILAQVSALTGGPPDVFVCGVGTGGTVTGVGRRLKDTNGSTRVAIAVPDVFPGIEGLKPLGHEGDLVPAILDESLIDERIPVTSEEAVAEARALALCGLFVGPSSGAFVRAAREVAKRHRPATIVTVLADGGERYLSTGLWSGAA